MKHEYGSSHAGGGKNPKPSRPKTYQERVAHTDYLRDRSVGSPFSVNSDPSGGAEGSEEHRTNGGQ